MKLVTTITTTIIAIGLLAFAQAAPITSPIPPRSLGEGTASVTGTIYDFDDAKLKLVNATSHFSVGKRLVYFLKRAMPIDHPIDPAVSTIIDHKDTFAKKIRNTSIQSRKDNGDTAVGSRDAQHTGVGQCGQVNCPPPTSVGQCGKVNCPLN